MMLLPRPTYSNSWTQHQTTRCSNRCRCTSKDYHEQSVLPSTSQLIISRTCWNMLDFGTLYWPTYMIPASHRANQTRAKLIYGTPWNNWSKACPSKRQKYLYLKVILSTSPHDTHIHTSDTLAGLLHITNVLLTSVNTAIFTRLLKGKLPIELLTRSVQ